MSNNYFIVVPCHNEEDNIEKLISKINISVGNYDQYKILFIDDGSKDSSWSKIDSICNQNEKILGIKLSRNFGKDSAIEAGLNYLDQINDYKFAIIIDADLQHPVEKIKDMVDEWNKEYKIVTTHKKNNVENFFRKAGSDFFYFLMTNFSDAKFITKNTDFMLLDREIIKIYNKFTEKNKSVKTFINWIGFKTSSIPIEINKRSSGTSKYNFFNLTRTAVNAITSFSLFPIKIVGYLGITMSITSLIILPIFIICSWLNILSISIQTMIIIFNIFLTGIILSAVGLLGIYISRIHQSSINRPSYLIEKKNIK
tara:strand:+ start:1614 stop:2549 length:936 start_codon:yes stop_codon:yes gene_type:complete